MVDRGCLMDQVLFTVPEAMATGVRAVMGGLMPFGWFLPDVRGLGAIRGWTKPLYRSGESVDGTG